MHHLNHIFSFLHHVTILYHFHHSNPPFTPSRKLRASSRSSSKTALIENNIHLQELLTQQKLYLEIEAEADKMTDLPASTCFSIDENRAVHHQTTCKIEELANSPANSANSVNSTFARLVVEKSQIPSPPGPPPNLHKKAGKRMIMYSTGGNPTRKRERSSRRESLSIEFTREGLIKETKKELEKCCKERSLPSSGKKDELITRLINHEEQLREVNLDIHRTLDTNFKNLETNFENNAHLSDNKEEIQLLKEENERLKSLLANSIQLPPSAQIYTHQKQNSLGNQSGSSFNGFNSTNNINSSNGHIYSSNGHLSNGHISNGGLHTTSSEPNSPRIKHIALKPFVFKGANEIRDSQHRLCAPTPTPPPSEISQFQHPNNPNKNLNQNSNQNSNKNLNSINPNSIHSNAMKSNIPQNVIINQLPPNSFIRPSRSMASVSDSGLEGESNLLQRATMQTSYPTHTSSQSLTNPPLTNQPNFKNSLQNSLQNSFQNSLQNNQFSNHNFSSQNPNIHNRINPRPQVHHNRLSHPSTPLPPHCMDTTMSNSMNSPYSNFDKTSSQNALDACMSVGPPQNESETSEYRHEYSNSMTGANGDVHHYQRSDQGSRSEFQGSRSENQGPSQFQGSTNIHGQFPSRIPPFLVHNQSNGSLVSNTQMVITSTAPNSHTHALSSKSSSHISLHEPHRFQNLANQQIQQSQQSQQNLQNPMNPQDVQNPLRQPNFQHHNQLPPNNIRNLQNPTGHVATLPSSINGALSPPSYSNSTVRSKICVRHRHF